jgi:hypothetical protein
MGYWSLRFLSVIFSHHLILLLLSVLHHSSFLMQVLGYMKWSVVKWSFVKCCEVSEIVEISFIVCVSAYLPSYLTQYLHNTHGTAWYNMHCTALHCPPAWLPDCRLSSNVHAIISNQGNGRNNTYPPRNMGVGKRTPSVTTAVSIPSSHQSHHTPIRSFCPFILIPSYSSPKTHPLVPSLSSSSSLHLLFICSSYCTVLWSILGMWDYEQ